MKIITLPVSKYVVEIRESITYGEFEAIDNFWQNHMVLKIDGNKQTADVDGSLAQQAKDKMTQTFLHSCKKPGGEEISTIGLVAGLDLEDGFLITNTIADIYKELKKKLSPTTKE